MKKEEAIRKAKARLLPGVDTIQVMHRADGAYRVVVGFHDKDEPCMDSLLVAGFYDGDTKIWVEKVRHGANPTLK